VSAELRGAELAALNDALLLGVLRDLADEHGRAYAPNAVLANRLGLARSGKSCTALARRMRRLRQAGEVRTCIDQRGVWYHQLLP
jgi:hypothetical protein